MLSAEASTFPEILLERAERTPDRGAMNFLSLSNDPDPVSYAELVRSARAIAASLQQVGKPGDRVLLVCPPGRSFVEAFLGILLAGRVAVPGSPITGKRDRFRLRAIVDQVEPQVVCASASHARQVEQWAEGDASLAGVRALLLGDPTTHLKSLPELENLGASDWTPTTFAPDDLAFLQFTSGSVGDPKGVMVRHANLLHNLQQIARNFGHTEESVGVNWLPPYHDMGLIGGVLEPLHSGFPAVLMPALSLVRNPLNWLRALSDFGATISGGPGFAYQLCVDRIPDDELGSLDLSSWDVAFVGAEPIQARTLEAFSKRFAAAGFRPDRLHPCYGLAESVLMATAVARGSSWRSAAVPQGANQLTDFSFERASVVSCGVPQGAEVQIVDPSNPRPVGPGALGELWIRGESVAAGYWGQPKATAATFGAHLASGEGPFLRTGDLGFIRDGQLHICGRIKEIVVVDGRNIYPTDVERVVQDAIPGAKPNTGAAVAVRSEAGLERIAVIQETVVSRMSLAELEALASSVHASVAEAFGIQLATLVLVPRHTIPRTTSGKVKRLDCRARLMAGELVRLDLLARARAAATVSADSATTLPGNPEEKLVSMICGLIQESTVASGAVDPSASFADSGCDSKIAVALATKLAAAIGRSCEPELLYRFPTPKALARYLSGPQDETRDAQIRVVARNATPSAQREDIAVVGLASRFPGSDCTESFWRLINGPDDAIRRIPDGRWDIDRWLEEVGARRGTMYTDRLGSITAPDEFDATFFGIDRRTAAAMDPQQRIILELCWHALEDAYLAPRSLRGRNVGVFMGATHSDYARLHPGPSAITPHTAAGTSLSAIAGRVAYTMGLTGPAQVIDTACSSSLVALHTAVNALRAGDCEVALCGGVNLILSPEVSVAMCRMRALSPRGICAAFDESADGYVRGEGAGVVVLKPESQAIADGDRIYATIAGSAVNQDGASNGFAAPSGAAQEAVIRAALARVSSSIASDLAYVEAHGTGTPLGDPIELQALARAYGGRDDEHPLRVGSVKTHIGHLEAAAGIAGFIKTVLSVHHGVIPGNAHFRNASSRIPWSELAVRVERKPSPWPVGPTQRSAAVSSFGFTGTNAHVVLREAPAECSSPERPTRSAYVFVASARSPDALAELLESYRLWLERDEHTTLESLCAALATGRDHHEHRFAVVVSDRDELAAELGRTSRPDRAVDNQECTGEGGGGGNRSPEAAAASAFLAGEEVDWERYFGQCSVPVTSLPLYPFQRSRHWYESVVANTGKREATRGTSASLPA